MTDVDLHQTDLSGCAKAHSLKRVLQQQDRPAQRILLRIRSVRRRKRMNPRRTPTRSFQRVYVRQTNVYARSTRWIMSSRHRRRVRREWRFQHFNFSAEKSLEPKNSLTDPKRSSVIFRNKNGQFTSPPGETRPTLTVSTDSCLLPMSRNFDLENNKFNHSSSELTDSVSSASIEQETASELFEMICCRWSRSLLSSSQRKRKKARRKLPHPPHPPIVSRHRIESFCAGDWAVHIHPSHNHRLLFNAMHPPLSHQEQQHHLIQHSTRMVPPRIPCLHQRLSNKPLDPPRRRRRAKLSLLVCSRQHCPPRHRHRSHRPHVLSLPVVASERIRSTRHPQRPSQRPRIRIIPVFCFGVQPSVPVDIRVRQQSVHYRPLLIVTTTIITIPMLIILITRSTRIRSKSLSDESFQSSPSVWDPILFFWINSARWNRPNQPRSSPLNSSTASDPWWTPRSVTQLR